MQRRYAAGCMQPGVLVQARRVNLIITPRVLPLTAAVAAVAVAAVDAATAVQVQVLRNYLGTALIHAYELRLLTLLLLPLLLPLCRSKCCATT